MKKTVSTPAPAFSGLSKTQQVLMMETAVLREQLLRQSEERIEDRRKLDQILAGMHSAGLPHGKASRLSPLSQPLPSLRTRRDFSKAGGPSKLLPPLSPTSVIPGTSSGAVLDCAMYPNLCDD